MIRSLIVLMIILVMVALAMVIMSQTDSTTDYEPCASVAPAWIVCHK